MFSKDTGCCGPHLNENEFTFLGAATLSFPLLLLTLPLYLISRLFWKSRVSAAIHNLFYALINSIVFVVFFPQLKCRIAGALMPLSPKFSGILFRNFNLVSLSLLWWILLLLISYVF